MSKAIKAAIKKVWASSKLATKDLSADEYDEFLTELENEIEDERERLTAVREEDDEEDEELDDEEDELDDEDEDDEDDEELDDEDEDDED